jgi:hypothetical protein
MIIYCWIILEERKVSDQSSIENQKPHFMFNIFVSENLSAYEIITKHTAESSSSQMVELKNNMAPDRFTLYILAN